MEKNFSIEENRWKRRPRLGEVGDALWVTQVRLERCMLPIQVTLVESWT